MTTRDPAVQSFQSSVHDALAARSLGPEGTAAIDRMYGAGLARSCRVWGKPAACGVRRWPAGGVRHHTAAFAGHGAHRRRFCGDRAGAVLGASNRERPSRRANWPEGHANATIVGLDGLESRDDVHIGVSLLAPHVRYPDHTHGPEEICLVLSPDRFQHGEFGWFALDIGGTLCNQPNVRHAMASDGAPLFALWHPRTGRVA